MRAGPSSVKAPLVTEIFVESDVPSKSNAAVPVKPGKPRATLTRTPAVETSQVLRNRAPSPDTTSSHSSTVHESRSIKQSGPSSEQKDPLQHFGQQLKIAMSDLTSAPIMQYGTSAAEKPILAILDAYHAYIDAWSHMDVETTDAQAPLIKDLIKHTLEDGTSPISTNWLTETLEGISGLANVNETQIRMVCDGLKECIEENLCKTGLSGLSIMLADLTKNKASHTLAGIMRFARLVPQSTPIPAEFGAAGKNTPGTLHGFILDKVVEAMSAEQWNLMAELHGLDRLVAMRDVLQDYTNTLSSDDAAMPALQDTLAFSVTLITAFEKKEMERLGKQPDSLPLSSRIGDATAYVANRRELAQAVADTFTVKPELKDVDLVKTIQMSQKFKTAYARELTESRVELADLRERISINGKELPICKQFAKDFTRQETRLDSQPLVKNPNIPPKDQILDVFNTLSKFTNNNHKQIMAISVMANQITAGAIFIVDKQFQYFKLGTTGLKVSQEKLKGSESGINLPGTDPGLATSFTISRAKDGRIRILSTAVCEHFDKVFLRGDKNSDAAEIEKTDSLFRAEMEFFISDDGTITMGKNLGVFLHGERI